MQEKNLIFYDLETTGTKKDFSQIIQCGSIQTDRNLKVINTHNAKCGLLPWVSAEPRAIQVNKKTECLHSNNSHYNMMFEIQNKWKNWSVDIPNVFITFNGHSFDEEFIRRQFWSNLLDPYITNTNGNSRLDLMLMIHNIAAFFQDDFNFPEHEKGGIGHSLSALAKLHGIDIDNAHDAIADCNLMIDLTKIIKNTFPELFEFYIKISSKEGIRDELKNNEFFGLGEIFRRQVSKYPVAFCGSDQSRPNEIAFFDLGYDVDEYLDLDYSDICSMLIKPSKEDPIKICKINKTLPICPGNYIKDKDTFNYDFDSIRRKAEKINNNENFQEKVSNAMQDRLISFPDPSYMEGTIYSGGFASIRDKSLMQEFHLAEDVAYKIKISRNFEDERFKKFAERIIFSNYSIELPKDIQERCSNLINERLNTDGPWGNVPKSLDTVERMIETADSDKDVTLLKEVKASIENKLAQIKNGGMNLR